LVDAVRDLLKTDLLVVLDVYLQHGMPVATSSSSSELWWMDGGAEPVGQVSGGANVLHSAGVAAVSPDICILLRSRGVGTDAVLF